MSRTLVIYALLGMSASAHPVQVITYSATEEVKRAAKPYLSKAWQENGYVQVKVLLDNPAGKSCIAPTSTSFVGNLFFDKKLDVVITAQAVGFANIDSSREIPVAVYSWTGKQYCRSAWSFPVEIVPFTPMRSVSDAKASTEGEPNIVLRLRSVSKMDEQITSMAKAAIAISSQFATGGAATTIAAVTEYTTGPLQKYLSELISSNSNIDQVIPVALTWSAIASGLSEKNFSIKQADIYRFQSLEDEIEKIHVNKNRGDPILNISVQINTRRSLFVTDDKLDVTNSHLPPSATILTSPSALLSFPKTPGSTVGAGININQLLGATIPTATQQVMSSDSRQRGCETLLATLTGPFNLNVDMPMLFDAAMLSSIEKYQTNAQQYAPCLTKDVADVLKAYYKNQFYFPGAVVASNVELTLAPSPGWQPFYLDYLERLKDALIVQASREVRLKEVLPDNITASRVRWPNGLSSDKSASYARELFMALDVKRVGCMFGMQGGTGFGLAMIIVAKRLDGTYGPELVLLELTSTPTKLSEVPTSVQNVWVYDLLDQNDQQYLNNVAQAPFGDKSICAGTDPNRTEALIKKLSM